MPYTPNPIVQTFLDKASEGRQSPLRAINRALLPLGARAPKEDPGVPVNPTIKLIYGPGQAAPGSSNPFVGAPASGDALRHYVYSQLPKYGWDASQWGSLDQLIQHESGWRPDAANPSSSAYGLFQFLDSTRKNYGIGRDASWQDQVRAGLQYIKDRYQSPGGAWSFWQSNSPHWY